MRAIGILGGMGPRATVKFEQMLLDRIAGDDQQLPTIVTINDGSIPDRSLFLLGDGEDPVPRLQYNLNNLELLGAKIIAMPCNSASMPKIFNRLRSNVMLLNLPKLVVAKIEQQEVKKVYLLATDGTIESQTYQRLCKRAGIECIVPSVATRRMVTASIAAIKKGNSEVARDIARKIRVELESLPCDGVILGCTELPLVRKQLVPRDVICFDTLALLADACVELSKGENRAKRSVYA